jgi:hypothetical protein
MIEFAPITITSRPDRGLEAITVLLHGRPIGYLEPAADGRSARVTAGFGYDAEGCADVYDRDLHGRPRCIYRAAAELILQAGGHRERIVA